MTNKIESLVNPTKLAKLGIWKIDLQSNQVFWDSATRSIFEVTNYFEPDGSNGFDLFIESQNKDQFKKWINNAIDKGISFNEKFKIVTAKNTIKVVECNCVVETYKGRSINLMGTFVDVSKQHNLFKKFEFSSNRNPLEVSNLIDATILIDTITGKIIGCNTKAIYLTEYSRVELYELNNSQLFVEELKNKTFTFIDNGLNKNRSVKEDTYLTTKSGVLLPVTITLDNTVQKKDKPLILCTIKTTSSNKKLPIPSNIIAFATSKINEIIVIADHNGIALWANNAYYILTGLNRSDIIGKKISILFNCFDHEDKTQFLIDDAVKNKQDLKVTISDYNNKKEKYWLELNVSKTVDPCTNSLNFIITGQDITTRIMSNLKLQDLLETVSTQNNKLYNFTHIVSHNIRSHSSNLSMVVDIVENTEDIYEKISYFGLFKEATEKLSQSIAYLNEIVTIQQNTNREKKEVNLKNEIEKTKNALRLVIQESSITITDSIPDHINISVIPSYFESILLNLFTNAIKYKSINRNPTLEIGYQLIDNYIVINFKDNGLGLDLKKNGHKIFGMYKTFHGNDDARGIGLFITKNQLESMKGKIEVESEVNVGSNFKIYIYEK
ncbi:PAS domain S-box-containing protein [Flavobacterium sp. PL11]|uniref:PAS domain-containing protein n=1 Tax=Flavobacterium sp. PL11 TaxID=3071717 RepID=UPI002DF873F4|nr:PAS domain S-box-containing protein [Flavobacterium sp. PL11]